MADTADEVESGKLDGQRMTSMTWAELMRRVFAIDVLECPRCHGRMRVLAAVTHQDFHRKSPAVQERAGRASRVARSEAATAERLRGDG
jgi:hypothetical protein